MNGFPVIGSLRYSKGFWHRQGQTLQVARRKYIVKSCFDVQKKKRFWRKINAFSPLFYQKWIWTMLIRGSVSFYLNNREICDKM